jgi:small subunit ribosomal protein S10
MTPEKKKTPAKKSPAAKKPATKKTVVKKMPSKKPLPAKKEVTAKTAVPSKKSETKKQSLPPEAPAAAKAMEKGHPKIQGIRIRLSGFDHAVLDEAALKIVDTAERSGAVIHGPIPLPTKIKKFTVNRSTFVHKDARDQFEMRIHRRLIDLTETTFKTVDSLQNLSLPAGVNIEIRMG